MGGISSWITCIFELILGNTFAYCVFGSFGGYYFAFACTLTPSFSIAAGYSSPDELSKAIGVFFCVWGVLWFIFLLASLRTNAIFVWIFTTVDITALLLAATYFQSAEHHVESALRLQKVRKGMVMLTRHVADDIKQVAGGFLLAACMGGWYLLLIQLTGNRGLTARFPIWALGGEDTED